MKAAAAGPFGKHLAMHKMASGHDFWQSGKAGFWCGQQGIPSAMDAISDIPVANASSTGPALDRIIIEAARRLTIERIESKREKSDESCTTYLLILCTARKGANASRLQQLRDRLLPKWPIWRQPLRCPLFG
jgi:hypothetical protein